MRLLIPSGPVHAGDHLGRAQVRRRIAMAVETPLHLECLGPVEQRHLIDAPVAARARDAALHVDRVPKKT